MKAVLDIPDSSFLALFNMEDLVEIFCLNSGVEKPDVICLPIIDEGGAQFDSAYTSRANNMWSRYSVEKEIQNIRKKYPETKVYFSIEPTLPGIKASHLTCRDQYGAEREGVCIVNPYAQKTILDIVIEASRRFNPDGIILDTVDLHGQRSTGEGKPVDITCFCNYCKQGMQDLKFQSDLLSKRVSPLNLVLKATATGIRPLSPTPNSQFTPDQLVDFAIKEGFISEDDDQTLGWAQTIINYVRVRAKVTGSALGEICQGIKTEFPSMHVGAILNSEDFDWTGGLDLQSLAGQVDEAWLDINDLTPATVPPNIDIMAYAADRARYRIDAFFEVASDRRFLEGRLRTDTLENIVVILQERASGLEHVQNLDKTFVRSLQTMIYVHGFVGIPFSKKFSQQIITSIRDELVSILSNIQQKPSTVSKDIVRKYIATLVSFREEGNELNRREIVGLAAQMDLID